MHDKKMDTAWTCLLMVSFGTGVADVQVIILDTRGRSDNMKPIPAAVRPSDHVTREHLFV